jgi:hypothetical protein
MTGWNSLDVPPSMMDGERYGLFHATFDLHLRGEILMNVVFRSAAASA